MKISTVKKITALCKYLPEKDKFYADSFIDSVDFDYMEIHVIEED